MNKLRFMAVLLCLFLVNVMPVSASGEASPPKVMDEAELLSEAEEAALTEQIYGIGEKYQIDVILVMKMQIQEADLNAEAKNLYNQNGYGIGDDKNAIMLIIELNSGNCRVVQFGNENTFLAGGDLTQLLKNMATNYLSPGQYSEGFQIYLEGLSELYGKKQPADGGAAKDTSQTQKDVKTAPKKKSPLIYLIPAMICGGIITLIWRAFMNRKPETEYDQSNADAYRNTDASFHTRKTAVFLTSDITKKPIKKEQDQSVEEKKRG